MGLAGGRPTGLPDYDVDQATALVSQQLTNLVHTKVPAAARERGWASLQEELEKRPVCAKATVRTGSGPVRRALALPWPMHTHGLRWVVGGAVMVVALVAGILGVYGGTTLQTVDNDGGSATATPVAQSGGSLPGTTAPSQTTAVTQGTVTTAPRPLDTTHTTGASTVSSTGPTGSTTHTAGPKEQTTTSATPTSVRPNTPSSTNPQQNASGSTAATAKEAAFNLGTMVVSGDVTGARSLVDSGAQSSFAQMLLTLKQPYGFNLARFTAIGDGEFRVVLEVQDRVGNGDGELVETVRRFVLRIHVGDNTAVITSINAG